METSLPGMRQKQIIYSGHEIYISLNCKIIEMSRTALTELPPVLRALSEATCSIARYYIYIQVFQRAQRMCV